MPTYQVTGTVTIETIHYEVVPVDRTVMANGELEAEDIVIEAFWNECNDFQEVAEYDIIARLMSSPPAAILPNGYRPYASLPSQTPAISTPAPSRTLANGYRPYAGC